MKQKKIAPLFIFASFSMSSIKKVILILLSLTLSAKGIANDKYCWIMENKTPTFASGIDYRCLGATDFVFVNSDEARLMSPEPKSELCPEFMEGENIFFAKGPLENITLDTYVETEVGDEDNFYTYLESISCDVDVESELEYRRQLNKSEFWVTILYDRDGVLDGQILSEPYDSEEEAIDACKYIEAYATKYWPPEITWVDCTVS